MASITENKMWSLKDMTLEHRVIGLKWVFKLKRNKKREVVKHKTHLVAKGYVRSKWWTSKKCSRRWQGWNLSAYCWRSRHFTPGRSTHMDVKSAFFNRELKEATT